MNDIFSRNISHFGGSFSSDNVVMTFPSVGEFTTALNVGQGKGLLIQQMSVNYSQGVSKLYELGNPAIYYIGGRTDGTMQLSRVVGPTPVAVAFYTRYGDVCNAGSNMVDFTLKGGCNDALNTDRSFNQKYGLAVRVNFCVLTNLGLNINSNDVMVNESLGLMFGSLEYNSENGNAFSSAII